MVDHHYSVACRVDVELDSGRPELDSALEGGDRVLGMDLVRSAMGDGFWWLTAGACGQAFLSVVAFWAMSAKL
jgi:hypothetical protein